MDAKDEIASATEAFLEDAWQDDDDFFDDVVEEGNDDSEPTQPSTSGLCEEEDVLPKGVPPPSQDYVRVLRNFFGHSAFRPMQWKIIHAVLQKQDNCVVMATGYGKSLCFQFPSVYKDSVTVVVSPLISLMQDQVLALQALNIPACYLGSGQTRKSEVYGNMFKGEYRVVYVTPEFVEACSGILEDLMKKVGIMLFAIDEAHCVSQWGHDFRSSYRKLGSIRKTFPDVPILAMTATATHTVQQDICSVLKLRNPVVTVTSFDRPNLYLEVKLKSKNILEDLLPLMTRDTKGNYSLDGSTIIYCPTKKMTESVTSELRMAGVKCEMYHAGMNQQDRNSAHQNFACDKANLIVATVAFGMGINKPDVRRVIHYGSPGSLESYYQEIGRAGRDGLASTCTVFHGPSDDCVHRFFISNYNSEKFKEHQHAMLKKMSKFLNQTTCRRAVIISHFTSKLDKTPPRKGCCDNCTQSLLGGSTTPAWMASAFNEDDKYDFTREANQIFETVNRSSNLGARSLMFILRGSKSQRVKQHWMRLPTYGAGKDRNETFWKELIRMLVNSEWLTETLMSWGQGGGRGHSFGRGRGGKGDFMSYSAIGLSEGASKALRDPNIKICLTPSAIMMDQLSQVVRRSVVIPREATLTRPSQRIFNPRDFLCARTNQSEQNPASEPRPGGASSSASLPGIATRPDAMQGHPTEESEKVASPQKDYYDQEKEKLLMELYKSLLELRNCLADEINFMPYLVATNKTMLLLTQKRPTTLTSLETIEGMSKAKIARFGRYFTGHIRSFCQENNLDCPDCEPDMENHESKANDDWSFTKTSFGWRFKRNSAVSSSVPLSSGWLSKATPEPGTSNGKQTGSSHSQETTFKTENDDCEKPMMGGNTDFINASEKNYQKIKTENCEGSEEQKSEDNLTMDDKKKYTVPKLSEDIAEDFFDDFEDIDFSEEIDEPVKSETKSESQEVESRSPHLFSGSGKLQVRGNGLEVQSTNKQKQKRGIQYSEPPEPETDDTHKDTSYNKYEKMFLNRKRELKESNWIDSRKMKKKAKSNLRFKI